MTPTTQSAADAALLYRHDSRFPPRVRLALKIAAEDHDTTVREILIGNRSASVSAARAQAANTLRRMGLSLTETARYLAIHHSSVIAIEKKRPPIDATIPVPDLSGEWAI